METAATVISNLKKGQHIWSLLTFLELTSFLWPRSAVVKDGATHDFIIVGGGTAGSLIAGQLAKMSNVSILLIEAGGLPPLETELPGTFPFLKATKYDWNLTSTPDKCTMPNHKGHVSQIQQGKVLGGSGNVNYMFYGIGNPKDYDEWAKITNDISWSWNEVSPLFKRSEKLVDKNILNSPDKVFHGTNGKIRIKKYHADINDDYYESYKELGQKVVLDINANQTLGYSNAYFTIGEGIRQSTANGYISPEKDNPRLHVMMDSLVTKILFDEKKNAIGVEIKTKDNKVITVKARKEVIITAGVFKTPQLLMLSGIGPKKHLKSKKIEVISNLPVGQNLQDQAACILLYKMGKALPIHPSNPHEFPVPVMEGFVALNKSQNKADYHVLSSVVGNPTFFLEICSFIFNFNDDFCDKLNKDIAGRQVHFVTHYLLYPNSRGEVLLGSKDPNAKPIIIPRTYSEQKDLKDHAKYVDHYNAVLNTKFYKSVNAELVDPQFTACKGLQKGTLAYWKCYIRGMAVTSHMYVGTCAMESVVDSKLSVLGVQKLRVADASVIPKIVGSTIQATIFMIAQKVVDLLIKEHKL